MLSAFSTLPRFPATPARSLACILALAAAHGYARIDIAPTVLETGSSNLTAALTLSTPAHTPQAWDAHVSAPGSAPWCLLLASNGHVSHTKPIALPLAVRRDLSALTGTLSAVVVVQSGAQSVTATVTTVVSEQHNGIFLRIASDTRAYAGVPFRLDARGSLAWGARVYWCTNYQPDRPIADQALAEGYEGEAVFDDPDEFDLSLVSKDEHERESVDRYQRFRVFNSQPSVDPGGPYYGGYGETVTVVAAGSDPSAREVLTYSWQFNPPDGPFTPASLSPTATFVCTSLADTYIVCVVSDTWTGVEGSYNAPLGARAIAQVFVSNQPPTAEVAFRSNHQWSAWAPAVAVTAHRLPLRDVCLRARVSDADDPESVLGITWREHPANPRVGVLPAGATGELVCLAPMCVPGVYRFAAAGHDAEHEGAPAEAVITVPGVACAVMADGFQSALPVWGAYATPGAAGNTNAYGVPDETLPTRSDIDGRMFLDRPTGATCFVAIERTVNAFEHERSNYLFATTSADVTHPVPVFEFPVTRYLNGGRLVDSDAPTNGVPFADATLVMHAARVPTETTIAGGYSFGAIPKSWPVDEDTTGSYYFIFQKTGWASLCVKRTPASINQDVLDAVFPLCRTNITVSLAGTVRAAESGLPVGHATIAFGALVCTAAADGTFVFSNLPPALCFAPGDPTHVLVADADGYDATRTVLTGTATGGVVDVYLDGGASYLYGRVFDVNTGAPLSDGVVEAVVAPPAAPATCMPIPNSHTTSLSRSGYFNIRLPGGCTQVKITSRGAHQFVTVDREGSGTRALHTDIFFVPEPGVFGVSMIMLLVARQLARPK